MIHKFPYPLYLTAILSAVIRFLTPNFYAQVLVMFVIVVIYYYYKKSYSNFMQEKFGDIIKAGKDENSKISEEGILTLIKEKKPGDPDLMSLLHEQSKLKTWTVVVTISFLFVLYFR